MAAARFCSDEVESFFRRARRKVKRVNQPCGSGRISADVRLTLPAPDQRQYRHRAHEPRAHEPGGR